MKSGEKKENVIGAFYKGLGRLEKGRFMLWVQMTTSYSQSTVMARMRDDGWRPLERKAIEMGIQSGEWRE